jgi:hypothetical protein
VSEKVGFEVTNNRSVPEGHEARYVGRVHGYDSKPTRWLLDVLKNQNLQANQDVTFQTGGDAPRLLKKSGGDRLLTDGAACDLRGPRPLQRYPPR